MFMIADTDGISKPNINESWLSTENRGRTFAF